VSHTATNTANRSQGICNLELTFDVGIDHTKDVLKVIVFNNERLVVVVVVVVLLLLVWLRVGMTSVDCVGEMMGKSVNGGLVGGR